MTTLLESLTSKDKRPAVVADCVTLVDQEVGSKGGLSGIAIKAAYKLVKNFKPSFIPNVVDGLLEDFCKNLQPMADQAQAQKKSFSAFFSSNRAPMAEALLAITDDRAKHSKLAAVKGAYDGLRGTAKKHVEEAAPRVGALIEKHAS